MESVHETMNKVLSAISLSHSNPSAVNTQILKIHKQHIFEMKIFLLKAVQLYLYHVCYPLLQPPKKKKVNINLHSFHSFHFQRRGEKVAVSLNSQHKMILVIFP